jgi:hypothetical protein
MSTHEDRAWTLDGGGATSDPLDGSAGGTSPRIEDLPPGPETVGEGVLEQLVKLEVDRQVEAQVSAVRAIARMGTQIDAAEKLPETPPAFKQELTDLTGKPGDRIDEWRVVNEGPASIRITVTFETGRTHHVYLPKQIVRNLLPSLADAASR